MGARKISNTPNIDPISINLFNVKEKWSLILTQTSLNLLDGLQ
jgi:hypothetical protein